MFSLVPFRSGNVDRRKNPWDMGSIFEDFFKDSMFPTLYENSGQMKVDIRENAQNFVVDAEIPGAKKDEINLEIDDNMLTISVNHSEEVNDEKDNYIRKERRSSSMTRSFAVENIIPDKATAQFENGVLTITLPKREEHTRKSRKISIN